jgi:hypothetical protein
MTRRLPALLVLAFVASVAIVAHAGNRFAYEPPAVENTRAYQYAAMSSELCLAELRERSVPFEHAGPRRGVETPIRLTGAVRGVRYVQTWREEMDPRAPATILDCRLALAIDDMSRLLANRGVVEVEYLSMYRPGHRPPGVRHPAGRAIDVATARLADGTRYSVLHHFSGRVGAQTCGASATPPRRDGAGARFWRELLCDLDAARSFNLAISPNYDWGHRDHLHLEVRSGIRWYLTQ